MAAKNVVVSVQNLASILGVGATTSVFTSKRGKNYILLGSESIRVAEDCDPKASRLFVIEMRNSDGECWSFVSDKKPELKVAYTTPPLEL